MNEKNNSKNDNNENNKKDKIVFDGKPDYKDLISVIQGIVRDTWTDLHHTRNQDWKYWAIIGVTVGAIVTTGFKEDCTPCYLPVIFLSIFGLIISIFASLIAYKHKSVLKDKTKYLSQLEKMYDDIFIIQKEKDRIFSYKDWSDKNTKPKIIALTSTLIMCSFITMAILFLLAGIFCFINYKY